MKSNEERRKNIFQDVLPPKDSKEHAFLIDFLAKQREQNPQIKKTLQEYHKKAVKSLEAQYSSTSGHLTEIILRHYLNEFNYRAWNHGLRSMSVMFNIMEAFFIFQKSHIYFELIEEENYLISLFDFMDFTTSHDFENKKKIIEDSFTNNLIFNFNIGKDLHEIKFYTNDGVEFIIAGISMIRRDDEVTILLIAGRNILNEPEIVYDHTDIDFSKANPDKRSFLKEFQERTKGQKIEYEFIDDQKQFAKTVIAVRIDLASDTIDARYIAQEFNFHFDIVTDELAGFLNEKGEFDDRYDELYKNSISKIETHSAIFEVAKFSLYLPYYLNQNEERIEEELQETNYGQKYKSPIKQREFRDTFGHKGFKKSLFIVNFDSTNLPNTIKSRDDLFNIQTSGYWKKLAQNEIGLDKNSKPIHGKTWVNKSISWFQASNDELIVRKETQLFSGENSGYIYVMRNPYFGKNIFKIGLTTKEVKLRAEQLSKTSVPDKFHVVQEWNVKDCIKAEKEIHAQLKNYRVDPRREFFELEYDQIVKTITEVIFHINESD
jgi:hypothetical protein